MQEHQKKPVKVLIILLIIGMIIGSVIGKVIGVLLPDVIVKDVLITPAVIALSPTTIDLRVIQFTLGLTLRINVMGVAGILLGFFLFKKY